MVARIGTLNTESNTEYITSFIMHIYITSQKKELLITINHDFLGNP